MFRDWALHGAGPVRGKPRTLFDLKTAKKGACRVALPQFAPGSPTIHGICRLAEHITALIDVDDCGVTVSIPTIRTAELEAKNR